MHQARMNLIAKVVIKDCYDGDTCTTITGEKIRLACIDTHELRGKRADPIPAKAARDYLNGLIAREEVFITPMLITKTSLTMKLSS